MVWGVPVVGVVRVEGSSGVLGLPRGIAQPELPVIFILGRPGKKLKKKIKSAEQLTDFGRILHSTGQASSRAGSTSCK